MNRYEEIVKYEPERIKALKELDESLPDVNWKEVKKQNEIILERLVKEGFFD